MSTIECHGLDTPERVCFYEQDFYVLSNFSAFAVHWRGRRFDTSEAAYHWERFATGHANPERGPAHGALASDTMMTMACLRAKAGAQGEKTP